MGYGSGFQSPRTFRFRVMGHALFSDPRFWPKNGKSTLYRIFLNEVSFPMFIDARNRLQLFVYKEITKGNDICMKKWHDLEDFQVSRYLKIVTASYYITLY